MPNIFNSNICNYYLNDSSWLNEINNHCAFFGEYWVRRMCHFIGVLYILWGNWKHSLSIIDYQSMSWGTRLKASKSGDVILWLGYTMYEPVMDLSNVTQPRPKFFNVVSRFDNDMFLIWVSIKWSHPHCGKLHTQ